MCKIPFLSSPKAPDPTPAIAAQQAQIDADRQRQEQLAAAEAERKRQEEEQRQARIREGQGLISSTFAPFDDNYFSGVSKDYADYYTPQLKTQYDDALDRLKAELARTGNANSTEGARQYGLLLDRFGEQQQQILTGGESRAKAARANTEAARNELLTQNSAVADPSAIGSNAVARVAALRVPETFTPLADSFGDIMSGLVRNAGTGIAAERAGYPGLRSGLFTTPRSTSVRQVA